MDTLNNIRPGDRINISFSDSKVNKNNYKSSISDLISDDTWEITMPMESGKMVLFPLGISCDLVIFSQGNIMNKCTAVIKDRYKKDGLFFLIIKISSKLTKIQRREFFRVVCCIDMQYYTLETNEKRDKYGRSFFVLFIIRFFKRLPLWSYNGYKRWRNKIFQ